MVSFYYFVQFRDLKIRDFNNSSPNSTCEICKNNNHRSCIDCIYATGNTKLQDLFDPNKKILVMRGHHIKRADYYDKVVSDLIEWDGNIKEPEIEDISKYRQF